MPATQERVNGAIDSFYDQDTGAVSQDTLPTKYDFFHPGAKVEFIEKAQVNYLKITTPNGRVIVNDIKNGHI